MYGKIKALPFAIVLISPVINNIAVAESFFTNQIFKNKTETYEDYHVTADTQNAALSIQDGNLTLIGNSSILNTYDQGIGIYLSYQRTLSSSLTAENLTIETTGSSGYGINSNEGIHNIKLTDTSIKTSGKNAKGITINGDYSEEALIAKNLTIHTTGTQADIMEVLAGKVSIDGGTFITESTSASGIASDTLLIPGNVTGKTDISINNATFDIHGSYAVYSRGSQSKVSIDNITITMDRDGQTAYALWALNEGQLNVNDVTIYTTQNEFGVKAQSGANFNLTGDIIINPLDNISNNINEMSDTNKTFYNFDDQGFITNSEPNVKTTQKVAMLADGLNSMINLDAKTNITGKILAQNNALINLNTKTGSTLTGTIAYTTDGRVNFTGAGTTWNIAGDSPLNTLNLSNNSNINFAYSTDLNTVQAANFSGATNLNMKVDFDSKSSDKLIVTNSGAGNHTVSLVNNAAANTNGTETITIIETPDLNAEFTARNRYEFGGYLYGIQRVGADPSSTDWEVYSSGNLTNPAHSSLGVVMGNYLINLSEQEQLSQRMGVLHNTDPESGAWIRSYTGKFNSFESEQLKGFDMKYYGLQIGTDHKIKQLEHAAWHLGAAFGYTTADQNYAFGSGTQKSYSATLYTSYMNDNEWYADFYVKYAHYKNKLDVRDSLNNQVNSKGSANGFTASAEMGKRYYMTPSFYIEPTGQLVLGRIDSNHLNNSNGLDVDFKVQNSFLLNTASKFGYDIAVKEQPVSLYAKLGYTHEFDAKQKFSLNDSPEKINLGGNWITYSLGASTLINKTNVIFAEATANQGNRFDYYSANLGYKFFF